MMGGKCAGLGAGDGDDPDRDAAVHHGHPQHAAETMQPCDIPERCMRHLFGVRDGKWLAILGQPERHEILDRLGEVRPERLVGGRTGRRERGEMDVAIEEAEDGSGEPAEQPLGAARDCFEYRHCVRRRSGNDFQDVSGGGLALQRLLRLLEQPRVLDGDDGLVGEGLQQLNVMRDECTGLGAGDADLPYRHALVHQRCEQHAAVATCPRNVPDLA